MTVQVTGTHRATVTLIVSVAVFEMLPLFTGPLIDTLAVHAERGSLTTLIGADCQEGIWTLPLRLSINHAINIHPRDYMQVASKALKH